MKNYRYYLTVYRHNDNVYYSMIFGSCSADVEQVVFGTDGETLREMTKAVLDAIAIAFMDFQTPTPQQYAAKAREFAIARLNDGDVYLAMDDLVVAYMYEHNILDEWELWSWLEDNDLVISAL